MKDKLSKETYKEADKHVLLWVVYRPFVILVLLRLFGHQRQTGVVVVIEATMETAGRLVAVETMFHVTWMAAEERRTYMSKS